MPALGAGDWLLGILVDAALAALATALSTALAAWLTLGPRRARRDAHWVERARYAAAARQAVGTASLLAATTFATVLAARRESGLHALAAASACGLAGLPAAFAVERAWLPDPPRLGAWLRGRACQLIVLWPHLLLVLAIALVTPRALGMWSAVGLALGAAGAIAAVLGLTLRLAGALGLAAPPGPRLAGLVAQAAARTGRPAPRVHTLALNAANAFAWPVAQAVGVTQRALDALDDEALATVLAHELAHLSEPRPVALIRTLAPLALTPLTLLRPLLAGGHPLTALALFLAMIAALRVSRAVARRMEERADRAGHGAEVDPGAYARALAQLYEANAAPAVMPGRARAHPHLYDRLVEAGVTPDWPRPAPPPLGASRLVAVVAVALSLCGLLATGCAPDGNAPSPPAADTRTVACGTSHTCDLATDGTVRCWGDGTRGQLGAGTFALRADAAARRRHRRTSSRSRRAATRRAPSRARACSGAGAKTTTGSSATERSRTSRPRRRVEGLPPVRHVSLGYAHTCALDVDGGASCWGFNGTGTITEDGPRSLEAPTRVFADVEITSLMAGAASTCVVDTRRVATCAGDTATLPQAPLEGVRALVLTADWSCFARDEGLRCFGLRPGGTRERLPDEGAVLGALDVARTSGGGFDHACVVTMDGAVHCLGKNDAGQLSGPMARGPLPVPVDVPGAATSVAVGFTHGCAVVGGQTFCWGDDAAGQLGTGEGVTSLDPVAVPR